MPLPQHNSDQPEDNISLAELLAPIPKAASEPMPSSPSQPVTPQLTNEVLAKVDAVTRQGPGKPGESVHEYNERVKREFTEQVLEARRQAQAPPPKPQPVAPFILAQTQKEMERGAKQSKYWEEQQKQRPGPNARDIAAAGTTTPVFQPASYVHEKGKGYEGKQYSSSTLPSR